ncbi:DUF2520 domain-containing protein [Desulfobotulus sp. H1]|uniref:DUF2520 domain-containing protein n=1 Tax=Desulfobotulus pelophilus TaxID=2823377 RepID=A0ABT3N6N7_9BACT|nr:Rossmann-like and DUF2520 domain-containing protein [Desulfobotulus pelophilus]MCW7753129.1 DUF2520 domain-containing protein [Desulfobotulus pelophilus]
MKQSAGIIGCGRAGHHLAFQLQNNGWPVCGLWDLREETAREACDTMGIPMLSPETMADKADILFLALPDDSIAHACSELACKGVFRPGQIIFHLSGSQSSDLLTPAAKQGAFIGSFHPLQSFAKTLNQTDNPFQSILITVEGMPEAVATGLTMAERLGARGITIAAETKVLYHAAAVVASNYLVTLMDTAFELLDASGIDSSRAMSFLSPLVNGTLSNLHRMSPAAALTGPLVRGDTETLTRHLKAMKEKCPEHCRLYRELGHATLHIAEKGSHLSQERADAIRMVLAKRDA